MVIIEQLEDFPDIDNVVVTSGTFDGVHFGHRKILKRVVEAAQSSGGKSVVLTFWPHPRFVLAPDDNALKLLSTFDEKAALLDELGIDFLVKIKFTREFSQLSSSDFIRSILIDSLKTKLLIIGYDHRFGKNREGGFDYLKENSADFGFEVLEIPRQDIDDVGVSSTKIRASLESGAVNKAEEYLGRCYELEGRVVHGNRLGTKMGFPTANISVAESYKLIPKDGVYAVKVFVLNEWGTGMLNIGFRPTVDGSVRSIEVHLFDFDQEIYGESISIHFVEKLRDEKKFENLDELKKQLAIDKKSAQAILS